MVLALLLFLGVLLPSGPRLLVQGQSDCNYIMLWNLDWCHNFHSRVMLVLNSSYATVADAQAAAASTQLSIDSSASSISVAEDNTINSPDADGCGCSALLVNGQLQGAWFNDWCVYAYTTTPQACAGSDPPCTQYGQCASAAPLPLPTPTGSSRPTPTEPIYTTAPPSLPNTWPPPPTTLSTTTVGSPPPTSVSACLLQCGSTCIVNLAHQSCCPDGVTTYFNANGIQSCFATSYATTVPASCRRLCGSTCLDHAIDQACCPDGVTVYVVPQESFCSRQATVVPTTAQPTELRKASVGLYGTQLHNNTLR